MTIKNKSEVLRVFDGDVFRGTYVVYGLEKGTTTPFVCDVELRTLETTCYKFLRGPRLQRQLSGKAVGKPPQDYLHDEMIVIFGPDVSAKAAVEHLKVMIKSIKRNGLLIGHENEMADYLSETYDGEIVK